MTRHGPVSHGFSILRLLTDCEVRCAYHPGNYQKQKAKKEKPVNSSEDVMINFVEGSGAEEAVPVILARDVTGGVQFVGAIDTREPVFLADPNYIEMHQKLLSRYRFTYHEIGCKRSCRVLTRNNTLLSKEWKRLKKFFKGSSDD